MDDMPEGSGSESTLKSSLSYLRYTVEVVQRSENLRMEAIRDAIRAGATYRDVRVAAQCSYATIAKALRERS